MEMKIYPLYIHVFATIGFAKVAATRMKTVPHFPDLHACGDHLNSICLRLGGQNSRKIL